jgi:hypothetical protein
MGFVSLWYIYGTMLMWKSMKWKIRQLFFGFRRGGGAVVCVCIYGEGNLKPSLYLELPRLEVGSPIPFNTSFIHVVWVPQYIIQTQKPLPLPPHSSSPLKERGNKKEVIQVWNPKCFKN